MGISQAILQSAFITHKMSAHHGFQMQSALPQTIEDLGFFLLTPYVPLAAIIWPIVEIPVCALCLCAFYLFIIFPRRAYVAAPGRQESSVNFSSLSLLI